jgi:LPS sulfotransferase NodH
MARFGTEVWGCLFSFLRISGRAIDHLLPRRQALLARWQAANAAGPQLKWPNDESFVATELHAAGMPMADLNDFGHRVYGRGWGWHFPIHPAAPAFERPDGQIYHPVAADTAGFLRRIERTLARLEAAGDAGRILPGLTRALKTLPLEAGRPAGLDVRPEAEAALAAMVAASALPGQGEGIGQLANELFPPREGVAEITHHAVAGRPGPGWRVAAAADFRLGPAVAAPCLPRGQATAYAADFATRRLALTLTPSSTGLLAAPFFYQAQREAARSVAFLPFDRLPEAYPAVGDPAAAPLIVMSPGRCGSTFMNVLLAAAGLTAVSEPDTFAQAPGLMGREAAQAGRGADACRADAVAVLRATVASLACATATDTGRLALKLRSQANPAAAAIRDAFPQARFLFLFRDAEPWVRSFVTAFGHEAPRLVSNLAAAIRACALIADGGARVAIMTYEQLARDPAAALEALAATGLLAGPPPDPAALAQAAAADSQAGTAISREARAARGAGEDPAVAATLAAFRELWPAARPSAEIARLGLPF